jgi:hypothetical protein
MAELDRRRFEEQWERRRRPVSLLDGAAVLG